MESNIDKYSHKLSVKNNISYEVARHELERKINMAKSAYKDIRFNMNGGSKIYKITYNL